MTATVPRWPGKSPEACGWNARLDDARLEDCPWNDEVGQHHKWRSWCGGWAKAELAIQRQKKNAA